MNEERDKFLTEQVLGECWHEKAKVFHNPAGHMAKCTCGKLSVPQSTQELGKIPWEFIQHDFSTPEGFFKLWNAAKEKDWWPKFMFDADGHAKTPIMVLINPDHLANALEAFLKERE